ncbi:MAG TPA: hypothetical protein DC058_20640 [Planctomycetaceae bacterium]|nr:hypothetical protein [Planctomycetaceae bacterium]
MRGSEFLPETLPSVLRQFPARPGIGAVHKRFTEESADAVVLSSRLRKRISALKILLPSAGILVDGLEKKKSGRFLAGNFGGVPGNVWILPCFSGIVGVLWGGVARRS